MDEKSISKIQIEINGKIRELFKSYEYYNLYHPYTKGIYNLNMGEFIYSFSLYPLSNIQPSGTFNMSYANSGLIQIELTKNAASQIAAGSVEMTVDIIACSYNVFLIVGGLGGLIFI